MSNLTYKNDYGFYLQIHNTYQYDVLTKDFF